MNELAAITAAFDALCREGRPSALATVIAVEGSSYRLPGARMLVAPDGRTWGGVSGGCLERDVARRALGVIETRRPLRCRYDTGDDEELTHGAATGCGGTVHLHLQALSAERQGPLTLIAQVLHTRESLRIVTALNATESLADLEGHSWTLPRNTGFQPVRNVQEVPEPQSLDAPYHTHGLEARVTGMLSDVDPTRPHLLHHPHATLFVEAIHPPQAVVIFGAGPDVPPLVAIAKTLGWHVTVVAARPATSVHDRLGAAADAIHVTGADAPTAGVPLPDDAAVLLMTHNLARDRAILSALPPRLRYLGILGPTSRTRRLFDDAPIDLAHVHAPVGLDLGARTPEEIALAIAAEIQAAIRHTAAGFLRDRPGPIHDRCRPSTSDPTTPACPA